MPKQIRYVVWVFRLLLFIFFLGFALLNTEPVPLRFYLGTVWTAPLVLLLLIAFAVGVGAGLVTGVTQRIRMRRDVLQAKREVRELRRAKRATPHGPPAIAPRTEGDIYDAI